jgi:hypothetical protein
MIFIAIKLYKPQTDKIQKSGSELLAFAVKKNARRFLGYAGGKDKKG